MTLTRHPYSALFAQFDLSAPELAELAADIQANYLRQPIVLYQGQVLDGWNRYQACLLGNIEPLTIEYESDDPWGYVCSVNFLRRSLTAEQKAIVYLLKDQLDGGVSIDTPPSVRAIVKQFDVSHATAQRLQTIAKDATPEVKEAVIEGKASIGKAAQVAKLPKEKQGEALHAPKKPRQGGSKCTPAEGVHKCTPSATDQLMAEALDDFDPFVEIEQLNAQVVTLMQRIEALETDDNKKEISRLFTLNGTLEARLQQELAKNERLYKEREAMGKQLGRLCHELGLDDDRQLLARVKQLKAAGELTK